MYFHEQNMLLVMYSLSLKHIIKTLCWPACVKMVQHSVIDLLKTHTLNCFPVVSEFAKTCTSSQFVPIMKNSQYF